MVYDGERQTMDRNERLLKRVVQERSGRGHRLGVPTEWLVVGLLVVVLAGLAASVRTFSSFGPAEPSSTAPNATSAGVSNLGQRSDAPARTAVAAPAQLTPAAAQGAAHPSRYTVQQGDSLQSIAARNGLQAATLAAVNDIDDPDLLQPGSTLEVPDSDGLVHVVEPGETLRSIAERYGLDVATLVSANKLSDPDQIAVGLRLFIPMRAGVESERH
jgi:LysM repeat protein